MGAGDRGSGEAHPVSDFRFKNRCPCPLTLVCLLITVDNQMSQLKNDYRQMQQMFFEEPPSFERIMEKLKGIEEKINVKTK